MFFATIGLMAAFAVPATAAEHPAAGPLVPGDAVASQEKDGDQALARYLQASRTGIVRGATMVARFAGRLPGMGKAATIEAKRRITREGHLEYEVTGRSGDSTVLKELIARYMGGEVEASTRDNHTVAITPENYKFKFKGKRVTGDRLVSVFELNPRKKRQGLFKGEIWVDAETGLTVREAGRFIKSPSVFLKKVEFARDYTIKEGRAVPVAMQTNIQTRFWGDAELSVEYSDFSFEDSAYSASN